MAQTTRPELVPVQPVIEVLTGVGVVLLAVVLLVLVSVLVQPIA